MNSYENQLHDYTDLVPSKKGIYEMFDNFWKASLRLCMALVWMVLFLIPVSIPILTITALVKYLFY